MPKLLKTPFAIDAAEGFRTDIQESTGAAPNSATYQVGFPPITMQSISASGMPPKGSDLNGVLYDITDNLVFLTQGGGYGFDAAYATSIGGYPLNARLRLTNGDIVKSTIDGNTNDPNVDMAGWLNSDKYLKEKTLNLLDFLTAAELSAYNIDYKSVDIKQALDRAVFAANSLNLKLHAYGKFRTANSCFVYCDADLSSATLEYEYPSGVALIIGNINGDTLASRSIRAFKVANTVKVSGDNWVSTTATGIQTMNLDTCDIYIPLISNFAVGFEEYASLDKGNCYSTITLGKLSNNKINHQIGNDGSSAWVNENLHIGGRFQHLDAEGADIAGCMHINIKPFKNSSNNNVWYKPSLEGKAIEFNVSNGGQWNSILQARWESPIPRVRYICVDESESVANQGNNNVISGGYLVDNIQFTNVGTGSAFRNQLFGIGRELRNISSAIGGLRYRSSTGDNSAILSFFSAATNINSATYSERSAAFYANGLAYKRSTDAFDRIKLDGQQGRIYLGNGVSDSDVYLSALAGVLRVSARFLNPLADDTTDLGQDSTRYKQAFLKRGFGAWGVNPPTTQLSITGKKVPATMVEQNEVLDKLVAVCVSYGLAIDSRI